MSSDVILRLRRFFHEHERDKSALYNSPQIYRGGFRRQPASPSAAVAIIRECASTAAEPCLKGHETWQLNASSE